jgi:DNA-binding LacI/PurR family transcriptional regulator
MPKKNSRRVTSKQIGERAGVSQTTVSFVLNNVEGVNISPETRQRVKDVARELGYVPDAMARSLARGQSSNIGFIIGQPHKQFLIDEYLPAVMTGLSRVIGEQDFRLLVEFVAHGKNPDTYMGLVRGGEVAGAILSLYGPTPNDVENIVTLVDEGYPIVSIGYLHPRIHSVSLDRMKGVRQVVQHLIDLGHRRIACITYAPLPLNRHNQRRLLTYRETLEAARIPYDEALVRYGSYDPETGYVAMKSLLQASELPTAVFGMNDVMAYGAMAAIHEAGLRIPDDISVVGFDDIRLAAFANPPLTTVHEPAVEHGQRVAEILIALISGQVPDNPHEVIDTQIVVRGSSAPPRA